MRASLNWDDRRVMHPSQVEERFGEKPEPCPFCNCRAIGLWVGPSPHMTCSSCGADGPTFDGSRETIEMRQHQAVKAWNGSMPRQPVWKPDAI
jgi:hypothetical protein